MNDCGIQYSKSSRINKMTKNNVKKVGGTKWARDYRRDDPDSYGEARRLVSKQYVEVEILEVDDDISHCFAIVADVDFWLDSFPTREQAEAQCAKMQWTVVPKSHPVIPPGDIDQWRSYLRSTISDRALGETI